MSEIDCETWRQRAAKLLVDAHPPSRMHWQKRREWYEERAALLKQEENVKGGRPAEG